MERQISDSDTDIHEGQSTVGVGELFFKYRDYTPVPLLIILFSVASPTVASATIGTLFIILGELFRLYSVSFIGSISRTRSSNTGNNLIKEGPFAWMRNPLYVGNFIIVIGFAIFSAVGWFILVCALLCALQYYFIVQYEESVLKEKFGDEYLNYCEEVPTWFPKKTPKLANIDWPESFSPAIRSEKRTLTAVVVLLLLLIIING